MGGGLLKIWGVKMATIKCAYFSGLTETPPFVGVIIDAIRQLGSRALLTLNEGWSPQTHIGAGDEEWLTDFSDMLYCNVFRDTYDPPRANCVERHICKEAIRCFLTLPDVNDWPHQLASQLGHVFAKVLKALISRSVLWTTDA